MSDEEALARALSWHEQVPYDQMTPAQQAAWLLQAQRTLRRMAEVRHEH